MLALRGRGEFRAAVIQHGDGARIGQFEIAVLRMNRVKHCAHVAGGGVVRHRLEGFVGVDYRMVWRPGEILLYTCRWKGKCLPNFRARQDDGSRPFGKELSRGRNIGFDIELRLTVRERATGHRQEAAFSGYQILEARQVQHLGEIGGRARQNCDGVLVVLGCERVADECRNFRCIVELVDTVCVQRFPFGRQLRERHGKHRCLVLDLSVGGKSDRKISANPAEPSVDGARVEAAHRFAVCRRAEIRPADAYRYDACFVLSVEAVEQCKRQRAVDAGTHAGVEDDPNRGLCLSLKLHSCLPNGPSLSSGRPTFRWNRQSVRHVHPSGPSWRGRDSTSAFLSGN